MRRMMWTWLLSHSDIHTGIDIYYNSLRKFIIFVGHHLNKIICQLGYAISSRGHVEWATSKQRLATTTTIGLFSV